MNDIQGETLDGVGGNVAPESTEGDDSLRSMAEMMTPEERTKMMSILQGMKKKDRMSGDLSLTEDVEAGSDESNGN